MLHTGQTIAGRICPMTEVVGIGRTRRELSQAEICCQVGILKSSGVDPGADRTSRQGC